MNPSQAPCWRRRLERVCPPSGAVLMEVCGTHTMTARRAGIHSLLPEGVRLLSGPGCPVCVTPITYIDHAIALSRLPGVAVASFGDLLRVPGSTSSLEEARAAGGDVRLVYSALDALELAHQEPTRLVVFLGVGFETTAPTTAAAVSEAYAQRMRNFTVLSAHRLIPPALQALLAPDARARADPPLRIDGFLAPGHVSAIIGTEPYQFIARQYHRPVVVAGFEPEEMLLAIELLLRQLSEGRAEVENGYRQAVRENGNPAARAVLARVFAPVAATWRGLGTLEASGLALRSDFAEHDAALRMKVDVEPPREVRGCCCGSILRGEVEPEDCPLFGLACTPEQPLGACMVSSEGACCAAFQFRRI